MTTPTEKHAHATSHIIPKPCCKRVGDDEFARHHGWCVLEDGHAAECMAVPPSYGPLIPQPGRRLMSVYRQDVSLKWHSSAEKQAEWLAKWRLQ